MRGMPGNAMAGKRIVYALIPFVQSQPRNSWINRGMHILPAPLLGPFSQTVICCTDDLCYCSASRPHPSLARESAESGVIFIRLLRIKPRIQRTLETLETCCSQRMICKKVTFYIYPSCPITVHCMAIYSCRQFLIRSRKI
ncbi:conserved hypothetical protein [Coccidioides posadasii str. Silveira]|uniref:Uncharacterized protein n=1 Tax=Coccidioides posadasii (strain RMSCC 757 / Silveira) TaxID=443226 RepID=E9D154_COCPS|nr:conserved hypothetical protein [Coccidioides posadasii str. Silveira]